jgi:CubicO group peptidase (beta-lactamase class C family)
MKIIKTFLRRKIEICIISLSVFVIQVSFAQNNARINTQELENKVDSLIMPLVDEGLLSGSILIAIRGNILLAKGYGLADRKHNIPNTSATIFRIGSITKTITALSVMQLQEKRKLNINDKLSKYLHDYPDGDKITIHNLLTHTSGIPSYNWLRSDNKPQELDTVINWINELTLQSEPGESFMYSNSGYALLTYIIEKVSGMKYEDYVKENIFIPCNMKNTGLHSMNNHIKNMAFGYGRIDYDGFKETTRPCPLAKGDGDLSSTVKDLSKFVMAFYNNKLISRESRKQMLETYKNNYALGWIIEKMHGEKLVYHNGGELGYMSNMMSFNDNELLVIYLFNSDFLLAHLVEEQLTAIALKKPWQPLFEKKNDQSTLNSFKTYTGEYAIDESSSFTISIEKGYIYFQESGQPKCEAYLFAENYIYIKEINSRIRFEQSEEGIIKYTAFFGLFLVTGERNSTK